jgi:hypothetical protein
MTNTLSITQLIGTGLIIAALSGPVLGQSIGSQLSEELKNNRGSNYVAPKRDTPERMQGREINRARGNAEQKAQDAARPIYAKVPVVLTVLCNQSNNLGFPAFEKQYELELKNGIGAIVDRYDDPRGKIIIESTSIQLTRDGRLRLITRGRAFDKSYFYQRTLVGTADPSASEIYATGQQLLGNVRDRNCSVNVVLGDGIKIAEVIDAPRVEAQKVQKELDDGLARLDAEISKTQADLSKFKATTTSIFQNILLPLSENPRDWMMRVSSVPVQQQQFCKIIDQFFDDLDEIKASRNEIKKRIAYKDRLSDISALLPKGRFENWVVRVLEIRVLSDGSAAVTLQPPCRALIGSDMCQSRAELYSGSIKPDTPMYRELAKVSTGDFVVVSGTMVAAELDKSTSLETSKAVYQSSENCLGDDANKKQDYFISNLTYLVSLK